LQGTLAALGVILAAVYMLSVVQKMFFGPLNNPKNEGLPDMSVREVIAVAPMIAMIFIIGFFPKIFLEPMAPTVEAALERYREHRTEFTQQEAGAPARLIARHGGRMEIGYPEAPGAGAAKPGPAEPTLAAIPSEPGLPPPGSRANPDAGMKLEAVQ
jgi:hypothetical protein